MNAVLAAYLFSSAGLAWGKSPEPPSAFQDVVTQMGADSRMKSLLGGHFDSFRGNFEEVANPVRLKDGGTFLDGWKEGSADTHAAAFVVYPDGRVYAAYYDGDQGQIRYFGGKRGRIHPAIQIWAKRFAPQFEILSQSDPQGLSSEPSAAIAANYPTPEDQEQMRKVASAIWGDALAAGWDMNAEVGDILGALTKEIMECSNAFDLVPRPVGWIPGWGYVAKTAVQITAYLIGVKKDRVYKTCVFVAALNWRSRIEMASAGI